MNALKQFFMSKDGIVAVLTLILTALVVDMDTVHPLVNFAARIVNFLVFIYIFWRAAGKPAHDFLQSRRDGIANDLEELEAKKVEAEKMLQDLEVRLSSLDAEREAILQESKKQAEILQEAILAKAREDAENILKKAKRTAELETKHAIEGLRAEASKAILEAAQKALLERLGPQAHARLIEEAVDKVVLQ